MSCDEYRDLIPLYIKKEISGEERILTKEHLSRCDQCRENYLSQIKIFYVLDREQIFKTVPESVLRSFNNEVQERIENFSSAKKINSRWLWYAAAAILIIGVIIGRITIPLESDTRIITNDSNLSLGQLLASEDWGRLEIVLSDRDEYRRYSTDSIPIHILLDKLAALQKMGIQSLPIAGTSRNNTENESIIKGEPQVKISLSDYIKLLEQTKLQRSRITLEEVSNLLMKM